MVIDHKSFNDFPKSSTLNLNDHQKGYKQVSVNLPLQFWTCAKQNIIEFKKALLFGIHFLIADKDEGITYEYPECNLHRKLKIVTAKLQEMSERYYQLEDQLQKINDPEKQEQIKDELNDAIDNELPQRENDPKETK